MRDGALGTEQLKIEVEWKPFQLNPPMPREGMNRREYRTRKFGSWEHSRMLDAQLRAAGAEVGIRFAHDKIERTPNTLASHQLIWLAGHYGRQDAVVEARQATRDPFLQPILDLAVPRMVFDRTLLVGDAAFIPRPHTAASTSKAAANAIALGETIRASSGDLDTALGKWESAQLTLGQRLEAQGRMLGNRSQFS
jgi:2-polyprenyl-6-methoxyphenol hydroxylase-like FAD-dependent oxidoreductase